MYVLLLHSFLRKRIDRDRLTTATQTFSSVLKILRSLRFPMSDPEKNKADMVQSVRSTIVVVYNSPGFLLSKHFPPRFTRNLLVTGWDLVVVLMDLMGKHILTYLN